jgi:hypothetical protein
VTDTDSIDVMLLAERMSFKADLVMRCLQQSYSLLEDKEDGIDLRSATSRSDLAFIWKVSFFIISKL